MITASEIYWILKLDDIQNVLLFFSIFTGVFGIFGTVLTSAWGICSSNDDYYANEKRVAACRKRFVITTSISALLVIATAMIPSTKQMAAIKVIPAIANSEIVGELSADAKELYRMGINAIKEQLTGNSKEKSNEGAEK